MDPKYATISLAALLHDIGKVGQRAYDFPDGLSSHSLSLQSMLCPSGQYGGYTHLHALYTNEFCGTLSTSTPKGINSSDLANLAAYHHKPADHLQSIIADADRLSSAMDREAMGDGEMSGHYRKVPLLPVTNYVSVRAKESPAKDYALGISNYSADSIFPQLHFSEVDLIQDYRQIWEKLLETVTRISIDNPLKYINTLLSLFEKFLWSIPSATNIAVPDISLFDHMKATSAIAGSLYCAKDFQKPFLMVAGDFGGIQKYVFKTGSEGMARALRARSFTVSTLSDSVAFYILERLGLTLTHSLTSAGGRFYLLLPNSPDTLNALTSTEAVLHKWITEEKLGEYRFNLAWMPCSPDNLKNFPQTILNLNHLLESKNLSGLTVLKNGARWATDRWLGSKYEGTYADICKSCLTKVKQSGDYCADCYADREEGRSLVKSGFQSITLGERNGGRLPFSTSELLTEPREVDRLSDIVVEFRGQIQSDFQVPYFTILKNNYVPRDDFGNVIEFSELAQRSQGNQLLGYLKADVDNLGFIMSRGLRTGEGDRNSLSRYATLSRTLEYFFSGYLHHFLQSKYSDVYTVFSGGDDLLLIGPWDRTLDLARDLREEFRRYTCGNKTWRISAGIALAKPRTPVRYGYKQADRLLKQSKSVPGKDSVTAFGVTLTWEEFSRAIEQANQLTAWFHAGAINSSMLHRLNHYGQQLLEFRQSGNTGYLRVIPQMIYDLSRNWKDGLDAQREAKQWARQFTNPEFKDIRLLSFICQYTINKIRG